MLQKGSCFGVDPCMFDIQDHVTVLYFDDPMFDRITDQTRFCNQCRTCLCGGRGERLRIDAPFCFDICLRGSCPCPCVPICCPTWFCPCVLRHYLFLDDAQKGMFEIKKARIEALRSANPTLTNGSNHNNNSNNNSVELANGRRIDNSI